MPLPIRDGNQSLTTLSTLIVNSAHVPAHTVVSLGSQAITDIAQAVSGVELGPNSISALEHISVTISAGTSITIGNVVSVTGGLTNAELRASSVTIGGSVQVSNFPAIQSVSFGNISGSVTATITGTPSVTFSPIQISNFPATQSVTFSSPVVTGTVELGPNSLTALENITVTMGQVTITGGLTDFELRSSPVTIGGSVTAVISGTSSVTFTQAPVTFGAITGSISVSNFPATQVVTFAQASVTFGTSSVTGAVSVLNFPATQTTTFSAITGSVSVLNLPATQAVTFTQASVTFGQASVTFGQAVVSASNIGDILSSVGTDNTADATTKFFKIGGHQDGSNQISHIVHVSAGGAMKVDATDSSITFGAILGTVTVGNSITISNFPATQAVTFTQASVTFGTPVVTGSVSVLNFPSTQTIAGTVTANDSGALSIVNSSTVTKADVKFTALAGAYNPTDVASTYTLRPLPTSFSGKLLIDASADSGGGSVVGYDGSAFIRVAQSPQSVITVGSLPAISGTVTANTAYSTSVTGTARGGTVTAMPVALVNSGVFGGSILDYNGTNTSLNVSIKRVGLNSLEAVDSTLPVSGTVTVGNSVTISALPSGALTTRFGSVTTANTAQITSAVTNTNRKYLLAQNISSGTVTIGIGFSPTTTQGIQLNAGAGLTFDSFCPTGAVYWLGAVTGAAFTILEG